MATAEPQVVPLSTSVFPWQRSMLERIAETEGLTGLSVTLRYVLTEYRNLKAAASVPAADREAPALAAAFRGEPECDNGSEED
jgi:hypothetical protein